MGRTLKFVDAAGSPDSRTEPLSHPKPYKLDDCAGPAARRDDMGTSRAPSANLSCPSEVPVTPSKTREVLSGSFGWARKVCRCLRCARWPRRRFRCGAHNTQGGFRVSRGSRGQRANSPVDRRSRKSGSGRSRTWCARNRRKSVRRRRYRRPERWYSPLFAGPRQRVCCPWWWSSRIEDLPESPWTPGAFPMMGVRENSIPNHCEFYHTGITPVFHQGVLTLNLGMSTC